MNVPTESVVSARHSVLTLGHAHKKISTLAGKIRLLALVSLSTQCELCRLFYYSSTNRNGKCNIERCVVV